MYCTSKACSRVYFTTYISSVFCLHVLSIFVNVVSAWNIMYLFYMLAPLWVSQRGFIIVAVYSFLVYTGLHLWIFNLSHGSCIPKSTKSAIILGGQTHSSKVRVGLYTCHSLITGHLTQFLDTRREIFSSYVIFPVQSNVLVQIFKFLCASIIKMKKN